MKRTVIFGICIIVFAAVFTLLRSASAYASPKAPDACITGSIKTNTTWTLAGSPYAVCNTSLTVVPTATLTIQPGVTVLFQAAPTNKLYIQGSLVATGSPTQPITLTGVSKAAGSWGGINIDGSLASPARLSLDYVTLEYGGVTGSSGAEIYADRAAITVTHSLVRNSGANGIYATFQAGVSVQTTSFISNTQNAIQLNEPSTDLNLSGLNASQNGTNAVRIAGLTTRMSGQRHWSNPGIPYIVESKVSNNPGDELSLEPGSTLEFTPNNLMSIGGRFDAIGLPGQPITLTGVTKTPGAWRGIYLDGGNNTAVAQFDYVTIEYGGSDVNGADIEVADGQLITHHSIIRGSLHDGVRFDFNASGSMLEGQITGNTQYGVRNMQPVHGVLASNNWWGDINGPHSDTPGCGPGNGNAVTAGVFFRPILTGTNVTVPFPLSNLPVISLTPQRWFAPANNLTRVYFDIQLHDGNGAPLPGRQVRLSTTLGHVVDGGVTDLNGGALGYVTSGTAGDATVTAHLDPNAANTCEGALSPATKVTFTPPLNLTDLLPNSPAPYLSNDISLTPMPVIVGITTTIHAVLTNPLTKTITVDVDFGFAQAGIGLTYGPIGKGIRGLVVPPMSSVPLTADFLPPVSGHYCVQVSYNITAIGALAVKTPLDGSSGLKQFNANVKPGPAAPPDSKDSLNKADKAFKAVNKIPAGPTQIQKAIAGGWWDQVKDAARKISQALGFDPPRQDFTTVTLPVRFPVPHVQSGVNIPPARAAALNAVSDALADVDVYGTAAATAFDRYGGASEAQDLTWASLQSNEMLYYQQQFATALVTYADRLDAFVSVLQSEHETQTVITVNDVINYQNRLKATGFTPQEIADAKLVGLSDAEIEEFRLETIAANPADIAGNLLDIYTQEAATMRDVGNTILHPAMFNPGASVGGTAGLAPQAYGNSMAQVFNTTDTIQVSNPLTQTMNLTARRINLPADWAVSLSQAQVDPGQTIPVTVTILTGTPLPQNSLPSIAVEGYVGSKLVGGVVIQIDVPQYMPFDGKVKMYLPILNK